jgi:EAL domain-containing protein (putative c-di-GMP-specific phosphodiesterase class I)
MAMVDREGPDRRGDVAGWLLRFAGVPAWRAAAWLTLLLAVVWASVYVGGGARTPLTHLFYVPIIVAVVPFGRRGALAVAVVAGILCGPLLPLDTASGDSQRIVDWLMRSGFFAVVAVLAGGVLSAVERRYRDELARQLERELEPTGVEAVDEDGCGVSAVLAGRRFHPVFQPVYSLGDGRLIAVEALTRFDVEPAAPPDVWFARAARAGVGVELELAAIAAALEASAVLPEGVALSVNCSPGTLCEPGLLRLVADRDPRPLIIEVTEHAIVDDYAWLTTAVDQLRRYDVRLAVDDAGAGFASLRHVVRLEPELIKLDISLTQNLRGDPIREALADCLIDFARRTGSRLVAEGIEQAADLTTWIELGADAVQGYLLGCPGPLPVDETNDRVVRSLPASAGVVLELDEPTVAGTSPPEDPR